MLKIEGLTKRYGKAVAVKELTLRARPGEVLALLGPNGAGKTTTIRCVTGLARPSGGTIEVAGHSVTRAPSLAKAAVGFVPDRAWFYPKVTARELLSYVATIREAANASQRMDELLERFALTEYADALTETYSHGMRQRLAFCVALIGNPQLLITDEPMVGLDVRGHHEVKSLFAEYAAAGRTVLFTTHTLSIAQEIADRVAVIDGGQLVALGTLPELQRLMSQPASATLEELFLKLTERKARHPTSAEASLSP